MTFEELKELAIHAARRTAPANYSVESVDKAFFEGLNELAGSVNQFMKNRYDIYEIVIQAADEINPKRVASALDPFAEIKFVPQGQKAVFKTKEGKQRAKKFITRVGLSGVYETFRLDTNTFELAAHAIGGGATVDFERMLDGSESIADVMDALTEGMEDAVFGEVQKALRGALNNADRPAANKFTGNSFDATEMVKLINVVRAYGNGVTIFAPPEFVAAMGADAIVPIGTFGNPASSGYHGIYSPDDIESIHNTGFITIFRGAPIVQIPQSYTDKQNKTTSVDPQLAYILPTGGEKVVKVVFEGDTQIYDFTNRDNSMEIYMYKKMGCAILTHYNWAIYQNTGITQTYVE